MLPIILVNFNSSDETLQCLDSIMQSYNQDFKIIVVDNKSLNSEYEKLINYKDNLTEDNQNKLVIIKSEVNNGFAYGNNLGIRYCLNNLEKWSFLWILNNDTIIYPNTINQILEYSKTIDHKCGIWGHLLLYRDNPNIIQAAGGKYNKLLGKGYNISDHLPNIEKNRIPDRLDYIIGASMIVRKEFIKEVGFMNEDYFLFFEELDWIERGKKMGWTINYTPSVNILHAHGGSTLKKDSITSFFSIKCSFRSRILFTRKFHFKYLPFVLATCTISSFCKMFKGNFRKGISLLYTSYKAVFSNSF